MQNISKLSRFSVANSKNLLKPAKFPHLNIHMNDKGIETYMRTWGACKDMQTIESYANSPRMSTHVFLYDIVNIFTVPGIT